MIDLRRPSPFIELASVEAWDAWFRWREHAVLRDFSIEDTWGRVATALASVEPAGEAAMWRTRFMEALASWRLLPDERLLADAGTERVTWRDGALCAVLNAAAFVSANHATAASIDLAALSDCAALAVRALDNAAQLGGIAAPSLRIGMIGIADALALSGLAYDSDAGRAQVSALGRTLAEGCLRGSVELAAERGRYAGDTRMVRARAMQRDMPQGLQDDLAHHGVCHDPLTAIILHHRLALLANDVADAMDPLRGENHINHIVAANGPRMIRSSGYALNLLRAGNIDGSARPDTLANQSWMAQIAMRVALQPWIDESITCPLLATRNPDEMQRREARELAARHGLGEPTWRSPSDPLPS